MNSSFISHVSQIGMQESSNNLNRAVENMYRKTHDLRRQVMPEYHEYYTNERYFCTHVIEMIVLIFVLVLAA